MGKHIYAVVIEETGDGAGDNFVTFTASVIETEGVEDASSLPRNRDTVGTLVVHNIDGNIDRLHGDFGEYIGGAIHNYWVNADEVGELVTEDNFSAWGN